MKRGVPNTTRMINKKGVYIMVVLAWIFGAIGGLCAVWGIVTATEVVSEYAGLTWMFWMVLSGILLLASIAFTVGRGGGFE
ncbi:hypothetical protein ES703_126007 [subsurface metagenome]